MLSHSPMTGMGKLILRKREEGSKGQKQREVSWARVGRGRTLTSEGFPGRTSTEESAAGGPYSVTALTGGS